MSAQMRKLALTVHVTFSVGLLGAIASFLTLAIAAVSSQNGEIVRAAYLAMDLIARFVIVPSAFASLVSGLVESLGTSWGVFRHYWVLAKLMLVVFATLVLLVKMSLIADAAGLATRTTASDPALHAAGTELVVHAAAGLSVLIVPAVLSVYKPKGLTPYGWRKHRAQRALALP